VVPAPVVGPLTPLPVEAVADESPYANIVAPAPMWPSAADLPPEQPLELLAPAESARTGLAALRGALPKLTLPRVSLPKLVMPRVALPSVALPSLALPSPALPGLSLRRVQVSARRLGAGSGFRRLLGVSAVSLAIAIAAGLLLPGASESEAVDEPAPAVVAEAPSGVSTGVVDALDELASEPQLTGDAASWAAPARPVAPPASDTAAAPVAAPTAAPTAAPVAASRAAPVPARTSGRSAPPAKPTRPSRPVAGVPRVRVDVRAFDERLRASTSAAVNAPPARLTDFKAP
jgi:hypothetical protein